MSFLLRWSVLWLSPQRLHAHPCRFTKQHERSLWSSVSVDPSAMTHPGRWSDYEPLKLDTVIAQWHSCNPLSCSYRSPMVVAHRACTASLLHPWRKPGHSHSSCWSVLSFGSLCLGDRVCDFVLPVVQRGQWSISEAKMGILTPSNLSRPCSVSGE